MMPLPIDIPKNIIAGYEMGKGLVEQHQFGGGKALDIGCGHGGHTLAYAEVFDEVIGIDLADRVDPEFLRTLSSAIDKITFMIMDAHNLGQFAGMGFDLVYSLSTFEHLLDWRRVLSLIPSLLASEGLLHIIISPLYYSPLGHHLRPTIGEWEHLLLPENELREKFLESEEEWYWKIYKELNRVTAAELLESLTEHFEMTFLEVKLKSIHYLGRKK